MNMEDFAAIFIKIVPLLAITIVLFLILREFWCWYFKINQRITLLKQIVENTSKSSS
jgi:hypothetical protein